MDIRLISNFICKIIWFAKDCQNRSLLCVSKLSFMGYGSNVKLSMLTSTFALSLIFSC